MTQESGYRVDLSIYSGPLDLLLHLIKEREVDIHDIPIGEITEQFLAHLEVVKRIDVDRAGEFVLMAATLMLIKSRTLLPRPEAEDEDDDFDPRADLVEQLLEYKRYKDASSALARAESDRELRYEGGVEPPVTEGDLDAGKLLEDVGVQDLLLAFERLMRETLADVDHMVQGEELPLREVSARILGELEQAAGPVPFRDLFRERRDRRYIISVFLSILELLRGKRVVLQPGDDVVDLAIGLPGPSGGPRGRIGSASP